MPVNSSTNSTLNPGFDVCFLSGTNSVVFTASLITYILLVPLFSFVFYISYRRWREQRSVATPTMTSHSDVFTFNMIAVEMIGLFGCWLHFDSIHTSRQSVSKVGIIISSVISPGQTLFHLLTCVERYLAVVHPVIYMRLKQSSGVRIRNISIVCVWLLCFSALGLVMAGSQYYLYYNFLLMGITFVVVLFCSLSVLCVLIRPGPGEVGGNGKRVDQSKQRAFYTILLIFGALFLRFFTNLLSFGVFFSSLLSATEGCLLLLVSTWFSLPCTLVLPLLFLQRAGKLPGCKHNTDSG